MTSQKPGSEVSVGRLILVPFLITLLVTVVRLVGELQQWPSPLFVRSAGGAGAIVGIVWLAPIFGMYFAYKVAAAGQGSGLVRAVLACIAGIVLLFGGAFLLFAKNASRPMQLGGVGLWVLAVLVPYFGWPELYKVLIAYAYSARIPVAIVMYFAMRAEWGTHYDAVPPQFEHVRFWSKYIKLGLIPQLMMWIAFTVLIGMLLGSILVAILRPGRSHSASQQPLNA